MSCPYHHNLCEKPYHEEHLIQKRCSETRYDDCSHYRELTERLVAFARSQKPQALEHFANLHSFDIFRRTMEA
jgi:hypothetical protein